MAWDTGGDLTLGPQKQLPPVTADSNWMTQRWRQRLHPDVLKLGVVSFLTDVSSEMIFAVFAVFFDGGRCVKCVAGSDRGAG